MAKPRPEKKHEEKPTPPAEQHVLPMQLKVGDRITDQRGEWRVIARPHTTLGGRSAHVRVELVDRPGVTEERIWAAHARVAVKRTGGT